MNNSREQKQESIKLALEEYLNTSEDMRSLTKIGEKYGVKRQTLSKKLKEQGYEVINYQNIARFNENIFDEIDTEEKAYWLGFIYADGNISKTGNRLEIRLSINDLDHLEKFKKFLELTSPIRTGICNGHGYCHLSIRNKHLWEKLYNYGCVPNKTLILKFPNVSIFKYPKLIYDFIRGYIDGDGSLYTYTSKNTIKTCLNLVGTEPFLKAVNFIFDNKGCIRNKTCKNWENKAFSLLFSNVDSRRISRILYEQSTIYLDRKYNKYKEFCLLEEKSSKRKSSKIGEGWDANTEITLKIAKGFNVL